MHLVQIFAFFVAPSLMILTVCKLGNHSRLVLLFAWLTLWPTCLPLPHISQTLAINASDKISLLTYKIFIKDMHFTHFVASMSIYFNDNCRRARRE